MLDVPTNWFQKAPNVPPAKQPWEAPRAFEGRFSDQAIVLRICQPRTEPEAIKSQAQAFDALKAQLTSAVLEPNPRVHLGEEPTFDRRPDLGIFGPDADKLEEPVLAILRKSPLQSELGVSKRYGPPGSRRVEVKPCPREGR